MQAMCPYCRCEVQPFSGEWMICEGCGTPHHRECFDENEGCTVFGCTFAPPDDPKVYVTAVDVSHGIALSNMQWAIMAPTGFGDVNAPIAVARKTTPAIPPPPPKTEPQLATAGPACASAPPIGMRSILAGGTVRPPKYRLIFILLGVFGGFLGVHNLYAGYVKRASAQLALTLLTFFYGAVVTWIWALVEVCTLTRDGNNTHFV